LMLIRRKIHALGSQINISHNNIRGKSDIVSEPSTASQTNSLQARIKPHLRGEGRQEGRKEKGGGTVVYLRRNIEFYQTLLFIRGKARKQQEQYEEEEFGRGAEWKWWQRRSKS